MRIGSTGVSQALLFTLLLSFDTDLEPNTEEPHLLTHFAWFRSGLPLGFQQVDYTLACQKNDHFVLNKGAFRARSAFKLQEMGKKYNLFKDSVRTIVDLGASPGGWCQVTLQSKKSNLKTIVAVDLLPFSPLPNVHFIQGDFLDPKIQLRIREYLHENATNGNGHNKADLVLSDMAGDLSGNRFKDEEAGMDICQAVWEFCKTGLRLGHVFADGVRRPGGTLVIKHFTYPRLQEFKRTFLDRSFDSVTLFKPEASRSESGEAYWVCKGYKGDMVGELIAPPQKEQQWEY
ncbi:Cell division protein FtsJ [Phaffia rhodozyma]|uniref:rRNA methyltransferase 2, mitochondrial n=1 Tax=Phaffia rhodozyma TaxID=264483 RepID=A0A0F7SL05_PHARH|nr:Cell division protein FtsJ [Phaffia rhodozyma]